jgi:hypothetical protein
MPVTNPVDDFPFSANQPELFHFEVVYNNGNVITDKYCCNYEPPGGIDEGYFELDLWYVLPDAYQDARMVGAWCEYFDICKGGVLSAACDSPDPVHIRCCGGYLFSKQPSGIYQVLAYEAHELYGPLLDYSYPSFDIFEVVLDFD